jgi:hypothetical protein
VRRDVGHAATHPSGALLNPHGRETLAGQLTLRRAVGLEGLARPNLKTLAHTDDGHPITKTEHLAQVIGQRNATSCIKRQLGHAAQDAGFQRGADRIAELQLLDHAQVTVKQGFSATLQAIGLDRGEAEHAVEGARDGGAEVLRHNDAPLAVHLLLERREEHALPLPKAPIGREIRDAPDPTGLTWDELGNNDTNGHFAVKTKMSHRLVT